MSRNTRARRKSIAMHAANMANTAPSTASPAEPREARKVMARVEKQLARLGEREGRLHEQMLEHATDHARVLGLNAELRAIVDEREALEVEWLEAADLVD